MGLGLLELGGDQIITSFWRGPGPLWRGLTINWLDLPKLEADWRAIIWQETELIPNEETEKIHLLRGE